MRKEKDALRTSSRFGAFAASKSFGIGPETEDSPSGSMTGAFFGGLWSSS